MASLDCVGPDQYRRAVTVDAPDVVGFLLSGREPDATALLFEHDTYSYGDLQRASASLARHLLDTGYSKGDRVLLIGANSFFWVAAYLGTMQAGLVTVPLPAAISPADLAHIVADTEPVAACCDASLVEAQAHALAGLRLITPDVLRRSDAGPPPNRSIAAGDLAALMFTSGSTGVPRGVMVSHRNIIANTSAIIESLALTSGDRIMAVLPFHYCFGASLLHTHLRAGGSVVVDSRFMYVETVLDRMIESACTGFAGVPTHFQTLLRNSTLRRRSFPHLRYLQQAGGHLAPPLIDALRAALPAAQVFVMYGQTEATARLSCLDPARLDAKRGSIGKGIRGVHLDVIGPGGHHVRPGEVGEIVAEGDNVTLGYWRAPEETKNKFDGGRLRTGDLATVDDDGFVYIVGRDSDFLKCRGERVACQRIEAVLLESDEIVDAAVIGVADEVLGEAAKAFVVPRQPAEGLIDRLHVFCRRHLPAHLVPKQFIPVEQLPRGDTGKVIKRLLHSQRVD